METRIHSSSHGQVPQWVPRFLDVNYFTSCRDHGAERNLFCASCDTGPLCTACVKEEHVNHTTLQIRKASHFLAIRIVDIQKFIDISHIQTYIINGAKIVFLQPRPQHNKLVKQGAQTCKSCGRNINADIGSFCSIACKFFGPRSNISLDANFTPVPQWKEQEDGLSTCGIDSPPAPLTPQSTDTESLQGRHRRKGIPHRAPLSGYYFDAAS